MKIILALMSVATIVAAGDETDRMQDIWKNCSQEAGFTGEPDGSCEYGKDDKTFACALHCLGGSLEMLNDKSELQESKMTTMMDTMFNALPDMPEEQKAEAKKMFENIKANIGICTEKANAAPDDVICNGKPGAKRVWTMGTCMCTEMKKMEN